MRAEDRLPAACLAAYLVVWILCAIGPSSRADWLLENMLTVAGLGALLFGYRRFRFSNRAYLQIIVFMVLHAIGGHYTYSEVPLGRWGSDALGLARNHYDRFVHFAFGLLMLRPMREIGFRHDGDLGRFGNLYFSVAGVGLWSMGYEIIEWLVAATVDPQAGSAYLGTQGDEWDAQKDMALAGFGSIVAMALTLVTDRRAGKV